MMTIGIEDYLETILLIKEKHQFVKSNQISEMLGISRPAVCKMIKILEEKNLITKNKNNIELTSTGLEIAEQTYLKHKTIKKFLISINVPIEIAEKDCCKIEHCISKETFDKIKEFANKANI